MRYTLNSQVLALSAHADGGEVVVAGREILRILRVEYNEISEVATLRQPGEQRKHFQYDVKWGTLHQKDTIATAGTNGTICLYDAKVGVLDRQLREHGRQVHKIAFNPVDGRLLLSASQDGTIKLWDLRERNSRFTFVGRADAVRDVQFNAGNVVEFAAAFDNGTVQVYITIERPFPSVWKLGSDSQYRDGTIARITCTSARSMHTMGRCSRWIGIRMESIVPVVVETETSRYGIYTPKTRARSPSTLSRLCVLSVGLPGDR